MRTDELRLIAEHNGRRPAPDAEVVAAGQGLTDPQARWLVEHMVGHPGRPLTEPIKVSRPLAELRATYVVCELEHFDGRLADDVEPMRSVPHWSFHTLNTACGR